MKTIENITIYKCDHCGKELKRKHAMEKHEKCCWNNPDNNHICFNNCHHLIRKNITLGIGKDEYISGEPITKTYNGFYCSLKNEFLLPKVIENKSDGNAFYGEDEKGNEVEQKSMPKECNDFKEYQYF